MKPNEWNVYRSFSQPSAHTAPLIGITSPSTCEKSNAATTAVPQSSSGQNLSDTPRATSPRDGWRGFSQDEIDYGIRAAVGL